MCWYTLNMAYSKPKTAEEDIMVIKFLRKDSDGNLISPYYRYKYELGKQTEKVTLIVEYDVCKAFSPEVPIIYKGYHSFEMPKKIRRNNPLPKMFMFYYGKGENSTWLCDFLSDTPYVCAIPKGTQYYVNDEHEIVSETIIVKEPLVCQRKTIE